MSNISAESISFAKFLRKYPLLIIPAYQRKYSWEEEQVVQLLEDIKNHTNTLSLESIYQTSDIVENLQPYYIGSVVTYKESYDSVSDNTIAYKIIDGQQRFTTFCLLIKVLQEKLEFLHKESEKDNLSAFISGNNKKFIYNKVRDFEDILSYRSDKTAIKLKSEVNAGSEKFNSSLENILTEGSNYSLYQEHFAKECRSKKDIKNSLQLLDNYLSNYYYINKFINENFFQSDNNEDIKKAQIEQFLKFVYTVYTCIYVTSVNTENFEYALTIFNTLNNRGMQLKVSDIFKSNIYNKLVQEITKKYVKENGLASSTSDKSIIYEQYISNNADIDRFNFIWECIDKITSKNPSYNKDDDHIISAFEVYKEYILASKGILDAAGKSSKVFYSYDTIERKPTERNYKNLITDINLIDKIKYIAIFDGLFSSYEFEIKEVSDSFNVNSSILNEYNVFFDDSKEKSYLDISPFFENKEFRLLMHIASRMPKTDYFNFKATIICGILKFFLDNSKLATSSDKDLKKDSVVFFDAKTIEHNIKNKKEDFFTFVKKFFGIYVLFTLNDRFKPSLLETFSRKVRTKFLNENFSFTTAYSEVFYEYFVTRLQQNEFDNKLFCFNKEDLINNSLKYLTFKTKDKTNLFLLLNNYLYQIEKGESIRFFDFDLDHIIPKTVVKDQAIQNRIGNLALLEPTLNKEKGNKGLAAFTGNGEYLKSYFEVNKRFLSIYPEFNEYDSKKCNSEKYQQIFNTHFNKLASYTIDRIIEYCEIQSDINSITRDLN